MTARSSDPGRERSLVERIAPVVEGAGCELVDVELLGAGRLRVLRITIDREPGGVSLDDCATVSRRLGPLLDVEDPVAGSYQLEVSSPGLDRPLKRERDYERFRGQRVKIETRRPLDPGGNRRRYSGVLDGTAEGSVAVVLDGGERVSIPLIEILRAHLVHDFGAG